MIPKGCTSTANAKTKRKNLEENEIIMPVEVNPKETNRAFAYELWMQVPGNLQKEINELRNLL